jgi:futalosine hydrolase
MKILLVVATEKELDGVLQSLTWEKDDLHSHQIETLVCGTGMVSTAFWLGKTLQLYLPDLAINIGIAGSFNRNIKIGEVVNVTSDCFSEMGAQDGEKFLTAYQISLLGEDEFPYENGKLLGSFNVISTALEALVKADGITVNTVHGDETAIQQVIHQYKPDVESMEGAAFFFACHQEKIPCLQIRAISNYVERRNRENWNIPLALENLSIALKTIIRSLD